MESTFTITKEAQISFDHVSIEEPQRMIPTRSIPAGATSDSDDSSLDNERNDGRTGSEPAIDDLSMVLDNFSIVSGGMRESADDQNEKFKVIHEGQSTRIYCVDDPENELGGCMGRVAIKSLNDEFSDDEQVFRLEKEYAISKHLSRCNTVRKALMQRSIDGIPTIILEWANGITLGEWISSLHSKRGTLPSLTKSSSNCAIICEGDLNIILQLAMNVSNALADIHDAGVVHNNLTSDNIIVDNNDENMGVKIIGLSSAYLLTLNEQKNDPGKPKDIRSLGLILFEMFTGRCPLQRRRGEEDARGGEGGNERAFILPRNQLVYMLTSRVPLIIAKLVLDLMEAEGSTYSSHSARDVSRELHSIKVDLGSIMLHVDNQTSLGRLQVPKNKLYGRDSHLLKLLDVCSKIGTSEGSKMVIVSGFSGAGKSALVQHTKDILEEESSVHFISGKFDQLQQMEPLSAIDAAFTEYTDKIIRKGSEAILQTREAIIKAIDTDIGVLTEVFPSLCQIIGQPTSDPMKLGSMEAKNRFKFIFQTFVQAVASPSHPIVLFLDDLQWTDELSMQLVSTLVADTENSNFLFIGSVRDNELGAGHPLLVQLNELEKKKVSITNINVGSISKEDVNTLISDAVGMPPQLTESFSHIVYQKTSGNALLVIQFLQSLWDEDLLLFSLNSNSWQWDSEAIEAKELPDDVGMLMSAKILQLPVECQHALKLLACVGSRCDKATVKLFMVDKKCLESKDSDMKNEKVNSEANREYSVLDCAVDEGLLKKEGSSFVFAHDQIQHAAYSLIPENEQGWLHHQIGCLLLKNASNDHVDEVFFIAVDQLNRGKNVVKEEHKKVELAKLNLRAGEKAMSLATFWSSASYFKTGMTLLCDGHWEKYYDLSIRLYSLYTDVEYCNGHFQEVGEVAEIVIRHAKSFHDKFGVYGTLIKALGAQYKLQRAIYMGFDVLSQLGVHCTSSLLDKSIVMRDIMHLRKTLTETSDAEFLRHKEMTDSNMIAAMKFLRSMAFLLVFTKQEYYPMIIAQMLNLTLLHGVCKESCIGLSSLGYLLCEIKDFDGSERIGRLSVLLLERLKAQEHRSIVYGTFFGIVRGWSGHIKLSIESLTNAYREGMQTGEIQHAMLIAYVYLSNSFVAGLNLVNLERELKLFGEQMIEYKQMYMNHLTLPIRHVILNLLCSTDKPLLLLGQDKDQKGILAQAIRENSMMMLCQIYIFAGIEAYIFGEYELAVNLVQKRRETEKEMAKKSDFYGMTDFFDGLIFLAMAQRSDDPQWIIFANNLMSNIERFAEIGPVNCEHKLLLLQAEMKSVQEEVKEASIKYELAIDAAGKNEFIHEQAIANERAADFYLRHGDPRAAHYYGEAQSLYLQWGARSKADHLIKRIPY